MAAACELADRGARVTILEKRPFLGGRVYSHRDEATGVNVDNGQHVFLGCCTEYIRFLKRLGVYDRVHLQRRLRVPVIDKIWGESTLAGADLPPPLHLLPSLLRFRSLSPVEKVRAAYAFQRIRSLDRERHPELDRVPFREWLRQNGQSDHAIESLWNLIVQPTLNDHVSRVSADLALMVFQEGFLRTRDGANVGWAKVGLSELLGDAARRYIEERMGEVRMECGVDGIEISDRAVARVLAGGAELTADAYVLALPPREVLGLLPVSVANAFFARIGRIEASPIVNVHLWYDRPVWDRAFAAFLNSPLQWAFNKTKLWGEGGSGQYIDISLSGAREWVDVPGAETVSLFEKEMQALIPAARGARVERALVTKQREATFAAKPGIGALRPQERTPIANLFLAGDWTATGWPATMESAVRSGLAAAAEAYKLHRGRSEARAAETVG